MTEILTINVQITGFESVKGKTGIANMIMFTGDCTSDIFSGKILPGGVDTQSAWKDRRYTLSARYILEGMDYTGKQCRMFIENTGTPKEGEEMVTVPRVLTDSKALAYLEEEDLRGTITEVPNGVTIHIFTQK